MPSLTITVSPASCASASAGPAEVSSALYVDWTVRKRGSPSTVTASAARMVSAWAGPLVEKPTVLPCAAASASLACSSLSVRAGLSGVSEWIWYRSSRSPSRASVSARWRS
ncbi:hypothetical protein STENM327S_01447 [Streptomyces tendae]